MSPIILDVSSFELSSLEREMLQHPLCGGLILFSRNYAERAQLKALIKDIRRSVSKPFLISVDHEGGRVQRFREGFTEIPAMANIERFSYSQKQDLHKSTIHKSTIHKSTIHKSTIHKSTIHKSNLQNSTSQTQGAQGYKSTTGDTSPQQRDLAQAMGFCMAYELRECDIDISFAPVLDLNGVSEVIGSRAFSSRPEQVIALSEAYIDGMHKAGMKSTGKHFPGHGSVTEDSHIAMPVDSRSFEQIQAQDMRVFEQLIKAQKVDAIMPAHVIYSDIDSKPAGFSSIWIRQILREQLGFDGVVFSDDLSMQAASIAGSITDRAEQAIEAGCDMVLVCNAPSEAEKVLDGLSQQATYSERWLKLLRQANSQATMQLPEMKSQYAHSTHLIDIANEQFS